MKEEGVTDSDLIDPGGRHNSVKMVLSCCNQLLTKEETLSMLRELMPDHWQDDNIQRLVNDFYTDYYNPSQRLTQFQKRIFRESRGAVGSLVTGRGTEEADRGSAEKHLHRSVSAALVKEVALLKPFLPHHSISDEACAGRG